MVRTLSQIAGEYGLSQNANRDMFTNSEESVYNTIQKALAQQESQTIESMAGRGMGRSSFTQGYLTQQQNDIYNNMFNQFAQNRLGFDTQSALSKQGYEQSSQLQQQKGQLDYSLGQQTANAGLQQGLIKGGLDMFAQSKGGKTQDGTFTAIGSAFGPVGTGVGAVLDWIF